MYDANINVPIVAKLSLISFSYSVRILPAISNPTAEEAPRV